ncbi:MAG: hypothetical protein ACFFED_00795 [Candidatus Thorarchaeota archaeon]
MASRKVIRWQGGLTNQMHGESKISFEEELAEIENHIEKRSRQGLVILLPMMLLLVVILVLRDSIQAVTLGMLTTSFFVIVIGGFIFSIHWGRNGRRFIYNLKVLNQISPPYPTILTRCAVVSRPPIYAIVRWGKPVLFFVRLLEPEDSTRSGIRIPNVTWRRHYEYDMEGVAIGRSEGFFVIPSGPNSFIEGNGVLYIVPLERDFWLPRKNPISGDILLNLIRQLNLDLVRKK